MHGNRQQVHDGRRFACGNHAVCGYFGVEPADGFHLDAEIEVERGCEGTIARVPLSEVQFAKLNSDLSVNLPHGG